MIESIGETAGEIWEYLNSNGDSTLPNLKRKLDLKPDQAIMAIGWLAREDKIKFVDQGKTTKIQINN